MSTTRIVPAHGGVVKLEDLDGLGQDFRPSVRAIVKVLWDWRKALPFGAARFFEDVPETERSVAGLELSVNVKSDVMTAIAVLEPLLMAPACVVLYQPNNLSFSGRVVAGDVGLHVRVLQEWVPAHDKFIARLDVGYLSRSEPADTGV